MNWLVDLAILLTLITAAYAGVKQGAIMVTLEFISLSLATSLAFLAYQPAGSLIHELFGPTLALSRVIAFVVLWVVIEITGAIGVRLAVLRRLHYSLHLTRANRLGGAFLNVLKYMVIVTLVLISFSAMPIEDLADTQAAVAQSYLGGQFQIISAPIKEQLARGIGHDLGQAFNFYTVTADPESTKRIELGYTTTSVKVDAPAEAAMLQLVNYERLSQGIAPLKLNVEARGVARTYAAQLFAKGYFSHIDNNGNTPFERLTAAGVRYHSAGENLALAPTLQLAHQGLMNSPPHRANILNPNFHTIGIGIIDGGPYGLMVAQEFTD